MKEKIFRGIRNLLGIGAVIFLSIFAAIDIGFISLARDLSTNETVAEYVFVFLAVVVIVVVALIAINFVKKE